MRRWYAAKTKPRQERQATVVFGQRGVEVFAPEIGVLRAGNASVAVRRLEPLFPGYLFARLEFNGPEWLTVRSAPGVAYFLGYDGVPIALPEELIEQIKARAEAQMRQGWAPRFRPGDRVVIAGGPLAGLDAVFDGTLSRSGRSQVLVSIVNRLVPVSVPVHLLRAAV